MATHSFPVCLSHNKCFLNLPCNVCISSSKPTSILNDSPEQPNGPNKKKPSNPHATNPAFHMPANTNKTGSSFRPQPIRQQFKLWTKRTYQLYVVKTTPVFDKRADLLTRSTTLLHIFLADLWCVWACLLPRIFPTFRLYALACCSLRAGGDTRSVRN